jgi:F0F1-type ATP synthase delta subunit
LEETVARVAEFKAKRWAEAFISVCTRNVDGFMTQADQAGVPKGELKKVAQDLAVSSALEGLRALQSLYNGLSGLQLRKLSGVSDAERLDRAIIKVIGENDMNKSMPLQYSRRLLVLLVQYGYWKEVAPLLVELMAQIQKMQGIIEVGLETAKICDGAFLADLEEKLIAKSGAKQVKIMFHVKPELIGGYRLQVNGIEYDYSLKSQLKMMQERWR